MINNGTSKLAIGLGNRIAQMTIVMDPDCMLEVTQELTQTRLNKGKFGSTGWKQLPRMKSLSMFTTAAAVTLDGSIL